MLEINVVIGTVYCELKISIEKKNSVKALVVATQNVTTGVPIQKSPHKSTFWERIYCMQFLIDHNVCSSTLTLKVLCVLSSVVNTANVEITHASCSCLQEDKNNEKFHNCHTKKWLWSLQIGDHLWEVSTILL